MMQRVRYRNTMHLNAVSNLFHRYLRVPYTLAVRYDQGSGMPIVMLHGIASNADTWARLIPLLSSEYRCVAIDLLGFGDSPKPAWSSYSIEQHIASIHHTIRSQHISGSFILIGHSMGSIIAAKYAARYPNEVSRLYMLSPPIVMPEASRKQSKFRLTKTSYAHVYKYIREHKGFTLRNVERIKKLIKNSSFDLSESNWDPFVKSLEQCIEKQLSIDSDLTNCKCPVEIYYGTRDRVISIKNVQSLSNVPQANLHAVPAWHRVGEKYSLILARDVLQYHETSSRPK